MTSSSHLKAGWTVGADADLNHALGLPRAGWSAPEFKPDAARSSFATAQSPIGLWLKSASAPTDICIKNF